MAKSKTTSAENFHQYTIIDARWPADKQKLFDVRYQVFVVEQQVPENEEWIGDDHQFDAVLAIDAHQTPVGTGRISKDGIIGRMAVVKDWRGRGVGSALMKRLLIVAADRGIKTAKLSAQLHAISFYQRHGFVAEGAVYLDAGIEHRTMKRVLIGASD